MEREFLIFGLEEKSEASEEDKTKAEAEEYMQSIAFSKLKGITGIVEVFNEHGWD